MPDSGHSAVPDGNYRTLQGPSAKEWARHRETIVGLYRQYPLKRVSEIMKRNYGFSARYAILLLIPALPAQPIDADRLLGSSPKRTNGRRPSARRRVTRWSRAAMLMGADLHIPPYHVTSLTRPEYLSGLGSLARRSSPRP
jgi:hypothetical protein